MATFVLMAFGFLACAGIVVVRSRTASFRAQVPEDYDSTSPRFDLRHHLNGPILCEGVIFGPTGRVVSKFVGDFDARWTNKGGEMSETFHYDSGAQQQRTWTMHVDDSGKIRATAPDIIGEGEGQQAGSTVVMRYRIRLPEDSGGHVLDVTDWMYLLGNGTIINRSQFRKFGIKVAELCATMRPRSSTT